MAKQAMEPQASERIRSRDLSWPFWPIVPIYPYGKRRTLRQEVVKDTIWTFEQLQGILYVVVPIRMTVVKLRAGGLLVYAPVAPTPECTRLLQELIDVHGEIKYVILPTVSGVEHKVFVAPFARKFSSAQVYVAAHQWSYPINLPLTWLGFPKQRTHLLPPHSSDVPFGDEFDYASLGPIDLGLGPFEEVALFHRQTHTLLVTDTIISIPEDPPAILQLDPYPLLFHAKDRAEDAIEDNPENRRKGWQRIALFSFYFRPSALETLRVGQSLRNAFRAAERSAKSYFGILPWQWKEDWRRSFEILRGGGRIFVAPILQRLILNRDPQATLRWVDTAIEWNFKRIIPCHFDSPLASDPQQFRHAFAFLEPGRDRAQYNLPEEDFELLSNLENTLNKRGIVPPSKV
ncbi:DUF4336 domain-containing protein [Synechococcus sp. PCC 7336]|uniref:DUF4336 domain-containing protein n=1 Tax=Synechococcus sp. PCC 7336 TaxID=195250 RepID=UPI00034CB532